MILCVCVCARFRKYIFVLCVAPSILNLYYNNHFIKCIQREKQVLLLCMVFLVVSPPLTQNPNLTVLSYIHTHTYSCIWIFTHRQKDANTYVKSWPVSRNRHQAHQVESYMNKLTKRAVMCSQLYPVDRHEYLSIMYWSNRSIFKWFWNMQTDIIIPTCTILLPFFRLFSPGAIRIYTMPFRAPLFCVAIQFAREKQQKKKERKDKKKKRTLSLFYQTDTHDTTYKHEICNVFKNPSQAMYKLEAVALPSCLWFDYNCNSTYYDEQNVSLSNNYRVPPNSRLKLVKIFHSNQCVFEWLYLLRFLLLGIRRQSMPTIWSTITHTNPLLTSPSLRQHNWAPTYTHRYTIWMHENVQQYAAPHTVYVCSWPDN